MHLGLLRSDPIKASEAARKAAQRRREARLGRKSLRDLLAERAELEENAEKIWGAYMAGVEAPEPGTRFRAAEALVQRVYGSR
jgi:hypothetical protein